MQLEKYSFTFGDLDINRNSIASVMGYQPNSINAQVEADIDEVMSNGEELCRMEGGYIIYESIVFDKENFQLSIDNQPLNIQRNVFQQIKKTEKVAVFVCTAGREISIRSKKFMKEGDLLKGYVYDTFGSIAVEAAMDLIQETLSRKMLITGMNITNRYSPGYCGWNITEQKKLFSLLPVKFCGIELTDTCLMLPIKSVSGIIGIGRDVKFNAYTCNLCDMQNCLYRNLHQEGL